MLRSLRVVRSGVQSLLDGTALVSTVVAAASTLALMVLIVGNIVFRVAGTSFLAGAEDVAGYLLLSCGIAGASGSIKSRVFIRLRPLFRVRGPRGNLLISYGVRLLAVAYFATLAAAAIKLATLSYTLQATSTGLWIVPLYIPEGVMAALLGGTALYVGLSLVERDSLVGQDELDDG